MFEEAYRLDTIAHNPLNKVPRYAQAETKRQLLSMEEARNVLDPSRWDNQIYYTANLLAASTGMRASEIRGLLVENWHDTYADVCKAYTDKGGFDLTKTNERRFAPIPSMD